MDNESEGQAQEVFGPNVWLVDEMYRKWQENPRSVGASWREFFEDYTPATGSVNKGAAVAGGASEGASAGARRAELVGDEDRDREAAAATDAPVTEPVAGV